MFLHLERPAQLRRKWNAKSILSVNGSPIFLRTRMTMWNRRHAVCIHFTTNSRCRSRTAWTGFNSECAFRLNITCDSNPTSPVITSSFITSNGIFNEVFFAPNRPLLTDFQRNSNQFLGRSNEDSWEKSKRKIKSQKTTWKCNSCSLITLHDKERNFFCKKDEKKMCTKFGLVLISYRIPYHTRFFPSLFLNFGFRVELFAHAQISVWQGNQMHRLQDNDDPFSHLFFVVLDMSFLFLPPASKGWGKVIFFFTGVCPRGEGGVPPGQDRVPLPSLPQSSQRYPLLLLSPSLLQVRGILPPLVYPCSPSPKREDHAGWLCSVNGMLLAFTQDDFRVALTHSKSTTL